MGLFNLLKELDQPGVAERQFEFRMKVMRDAAKSGGFTDSRHVEVLKGGMCTAYTLLWLREQWNMDGAFAFAPDGTYTGVLGPSGGGVGMLGVRLQTLYQHNAKSPEDVSMALEAIGQAVGLKLDASDYAEYENPRTALQALYASTEAGTYYVEMYMKIDNKNTSHAIGVNATRDQNPFVFDANCGEYRVINPLLFGMNLEEVYEDHLRATIQECLVTKVTGR